MITRETVGEHLRKFREGQHLTMDEITHRSGLQRNKIIAIEKGTANYTMDTWLRYIDALGVGELVARITLPGRSAPRRGLADLLDESVIIPAGKNKGKNSE